MCSPFRCCRKRGKVAAPRAVCATSMPSGLHPRLRRKRACISETAQTWATGTDCTWGVPKATRRQRSPRRWWCRRATTWWASRDEGTRTRAFRVPSGCTANEMRSTCEKRQSQTSFLRPSAAYHAGLLETSAFASSPLPFPRLTSRKQVFLKPRICTRIKGNIRSTCGHSFHQDYAGVFQPGLNLEQKIFRFESPW